MQIHILQYRKTYIITSFDFSINYVSLSNVPKKVSFNRRKITIPIPKKFCYVSVLKCRSKHSNFPLENVNFENGNEVEISRHITAVYVYWLSSGADRLAALAEEEARREKEVRCCVTDCELERVCLLC